MARPDRQQDAAAPAAEKPAPPEPAPGPTAAGQPRKVQEEKAGAEPATPPFEPIGESETLYGVPDGFWDEADSAPPAPERTTRNTRERPAPAAREHPAGTESADPRLALLQELFPGRIVSREPLPGDPDGAGSELESEGHEYSEADAGSPESPGEDA